MVLSVPDRSLTPAAIQSLTFEHPIETDRVRSGNKGEWLCLWKGRLMEETREEKEASQVRDLMIARDYLEHVWQGKPSCVIRRGGTLWLEYEVPGQWSVVYPMNHGEMKAREVLRVGEKEPLSWDLTLERALELMTKGAQNTGHNLQGTIQRFTVGQCYKFGILWTFKGEEFSAVWTVP